MELDYKISVGPVHSAIEQVKLSVAFFIKNNKFLKVIHFRLFVDQNEFYKNQFKSRIIILLTIKQVILYLMSENATDNIVCFCCCMQFREEVVLEPIRNGTDFQDVLK